MSKVPLGTTGKTGEKMPRKWHLEIYGFTIYYCAYIKK